MIRNTPREAHPVLEVDLPAGSRAWIDRDWLSDSAPHIVPALVLEPDGTLRFGEGELGTGTSPMGAMADLVARVAAPAAGLSCVEVLGGGAVAAAVRTLTGSKPLTENERPQCLIVVGGGADAIVAATERVPDAGLVVLAVERLGEPIEINLYRDIHRRGLRVIGVPGPTATAASAAGVDLPAPAPARAGEPLPNAPLYLLEA